MHGRVKVRTSAEQEAIKKKERAEKLVQYRAAIKTIFQKREDKVYDDELLLLTERMLLQNPDIYTLWNIRREAFKVNNWDEGVLDNIYKNELTLTENCLRGNPKSYYVWYQRSWIMEQLKEPDWKRELMLCAKCLNLDERNFHCWDYRQFVVKKAGISDEEEFDFSTTKILNNFSNYSSWHYRSRILSNMFRNNHDEHMINERKKEELDLVMNATFTDPGDSSAWFYQRWLLDSSKPSGTLWRAVVAKDIAILSFDSHVQGTSISFYLNGKKVEANWKSPNGKAFSEIWICDANEVFTEPGNETEFRIDVQDNNYKLTWNKEKNIWVYKLPMDIKETSFNDEQLNEQLSSYKQLSEMEPNNKWALLTGVFLMRKINRISFHDDILSSLGALMKVDYLRRNYYQDLRSKYVLEYELSQLWKAETDTEISSKIDLSNAGLTTLSNAQYLAFFEEVNLSTNELANSLHSISSLQSCEKLSLSCNHLKSLSDFPILPKLRALLLRKNDLTDPEDVINLVNRSNLVKLDLRDNPVWETEALKLQVMQACPALEFYID